MSSTYYIRQIAKGDLIQLRWLGDRRVPNREGGCWATVNKVLPDGRIIVFVDSYGTTRRITDEHIGRVDKKVGRNTYALAALRSTTTTGTTLVQAAS